MLSMIVCRCILLALLMPIVLFALTIYLISRPFQADNRDTLI